MKNVLLTGGSGFIGKNICESYLAEKYKIHAPTRSELDLSDDDSVKDFFIKNQFDVVIHSAYKPAHRNSKDQNNLLFNNSRMFFNLDKYSESFGKLLYLGSGAIYDMRQYQPKMTEEYFGKSIPIDDNGYTKYVIGKYIENTPKNFIDLRVFGVFGKYEDYAIRFISNAICKTIFDLPITIKQNRKFDYIYIDDLMPILEFFIDNDNVRHKSYNITPDDSIELLQIANIVNDISQKNLPIMVAFKEIAVEYGGSNLRLRGEFPNLSLIDVRTSIDSLYQWYLGNVNSINRDLLLTDK
jgi:UDP-glucose 4-epimerase